MKNLSRASESITSSEGMIARGVRGAVLGALLGGVGADLLGGDVGFWAMLGGVVGGVKNATDR